MTLTYLICLIAGAVLVSLSINDGDDPLTADGSGGNLAVLFSTPFWSFGLFGFGLSGLLMTLFNSGGTQATGLAVALVMGVVMGWAAAHLLRLLARREADSLVHNDELIGLEGCVTLAISEGERGFVEVTARGSLLRRPARSLSGALEKGRLVVVTASDQHTLQVEPLETDQRPD